MLLLKHLRISEISILDTETAKGPLSLRVKKQQPRYRPRDYISPYSFINYYNPKLNIFSKISKIIYDEM